MTISDFPGYAMLSGKSTKGRLACPHCRKNTQSRWLKYGRKFCYTCHRRFLPVGVKLRRDKVSFNGKIETEGKPPSLSGIDVLNELKDDGVLTDYKKENVKSRDILPSNMVKVLIELSNFFEQLCSKVNTILDLEKIQERIVLTICHLEKIFPPFFDIMEHLHVHLANEALGRSCSV